MRSCCCDNNPFESDRRQHDGEDPYLLAQVVRCGGVLDANETRKEFPSLAYMVEGFGARGGLARATAEQVRKALDDYEMPTDEELGWVDWGSGVTGRWLSPGWCRTSALAEASSWR